MARKKSPTLTETELRLMNVLWARGGSSVNDVLAALPDDPAPAYSTVLTTLRILEDKGYAKHKKGSLANPIAMMETEHESAGEALARIREITRETAVHPSSPG